MEIIVVWILLITAINKTLTGVKSQLTKNLTKLD